MAPPRRNWDRTWRALFSPVSQSRIVRGALYFLAQKYLSKRNVVLFFFHNFTFSLHYASAVCLWIQNAWLLSECRTFYKIYRDRYSLYKIWVWGHLKLILKYLFCETHRVIHRSKLYYCHFITCCLLVSKHIILYYEQSSQLQL